jgi:uncharacterized protein
MMLDLDKLTELPASVRLEEDAGRLSISENGVTVKNRVHVRLDVMPGDHIMYCAGRADCEVDLECSRCLESYGSNLEGEVEFSIRELADNSEISPDDIPENELVVAANATEVDISGPIREALILALPLKPLCRENCLGLCPICGENRNEHKCECKVEETDSRWDGLRDLLK